MQYLNYTNEIRDLSENFVSLPDLSSKKFQVVK
ncbi:MAG: hypothetical protein CM1200mP8_5840 [Chloroflexota bacterium]|nr:MAG: hypothetical protein CM1200mP8_5840 [Chloroflexota bacterium]